MQKQHAIDFMNNVKGELMKAQRKEYDAVKDAERYQRENDVLRA